MDGHIETLIAALMAAVKPGEKPSPLLTDAYKVAMAQAGFPLRRETFTLSFRKGGPFFVALDNGALVRALLPRPLNYREWCFLSSHGYDFTPAMNAALQGEVAVWAAPKGSWVHAGEPVLTVTGPSFLVSWLEPLLIATNYHLQVATALKAGETRFRVTCYEEGQIIRELAKVLDKKGLQITISQYAVDVESRVLGIRGALEGQEIGRGFEVGVRASTCYKQHLLCLKACQEGGINKTSNMLGAFDLGMTPVGTTGHEHQQRWGGDILAFRAVRDMRDATPSYLFDTFDAINSGIPSIQQVSQERPHNYGVRFDSGDQNRQLTLLLGAVGMSPTFIFEDGYTAERTAANEDFCKSLDIPPEKRLYGYGGYLVCASDWQQYTRNHVSMVYKLSESCGPRMKFAGSKSSIPGCPCILVDSYNNRLIAQQGEEVAGFLPLSYSHPWYDAPTLKLSPQTEQMVEQIFKDLNLDPQVLKDALSRYGK